MFIVVTMQIGAEEEFRLRLDSRVKVLECHVEMIGENLRRTVTVVGDAIGEFRQSFAYFSG